MTTALELAAHYYDRRAILDREARLDGVAALSAFSVFSNANIAAILDLSPSAVAKVTSKKDRTGGKLDPAALAPLLRYQRSSDVADLRLALTGMSAYTAARLLPEMSRNRLVRILERSEK